MWTVQFVHFAECVGGELAAVTASYAKVAHCAVGIHHSSLLATSIVLPWPFFQTLSADTVKVG